MCPQLTMQALNAADASEEDVSQKATCSCTASPPLRARFSRRVTQEHLLPPLTVLALPPPQGPGGGQLGLLSPTFPASP